MRVEDLVKELGIDTPGFFEDKLTRTYEIENSNKFGVINSKMDKREDLDFIEDDSFLDVDTAEMVYEFFDEDLDTDYILTLTADFENDAYELTVEEEEN